MSEQIGQPEQLHGVERVRATKPVTQPITRPPTYEAEYQYANTASPNYVKWGLGCLGISMLLFTVAAMLILIVTPVVFRGLEPQYQVALINRFPFMAAFRPTRVSELLPSAIANEAAAQALLSTPLAESTLVDAQGGSLISTPTPNVTPLPTRPQGTPPPTSVLMTNTPVMSTSVFTPTSIATSTSVPQPTLSLPTLVPTDIPVPSSAFVSGLKWMQQKWNSCGPANLTQVLHKYGWTGTQDDAIHFLKPFFQDKNVSPWQMIEFVNSNSNTFGLRAIYRVGGTPKLLKMLLASGYPVIIEKGDFIVGEGWMGHYLTMTGYDDLLGGFTGLNTNLNGAPDGHGQFYSYDEFDHFWQQFNRLFIVVYPINQEAELARLLGNYVDEAWAVHAALNVAKEEASATGSAYAWFNMGTNYTMLGQYKDAATAFDMARSMNKLEWRFLWYQFGPYEAYYNIGDYTAVLDLARTTISVGIEEASYWQGMALAALGRTKEAEVAFNKAIEGNSNFWPAKESLAQLQNGTFKPPQIAQR